MKRVRRFFRRLRGVLRARPLERDLDEQIASHLDEAADDLIRQGLSPGDARREAIRRFGGVARTREAYRDVRVFLALDYLQRDIRYAVRALRRNPGFTLAVLMVLAIGLGALTTVFALLHAVVLAPLPFPGADRLVAVRSSAPGLGLADAGLSSGLYFQYAEHARTLESLGVYEDRSLMNLRLPGEPTQRIHVTYASAALFKLLQARPAAGRLFTEEDGRPGFLNMRWQIPVLLSHRFWVNQFGADPRIVGRVVSINDNPREIVGVLQEGFTFPHDDTQMWMLIEPSRNSKALGWNLSWSAVGRMRPGVTAASARADLAQVLRGIEHTYVDATAEKMAEVQLAPVVIPLKSYVIGDIAPVLWLLFGGMSVLLLVAGANAGGLFLVRAEQRSREMAVRRALGAHGSHLAGLFVVEALLLTGAAAGLGLLMARGILSAVVAFIPVDLPRSAEIGIGGASVVFAVGVAVIISVFYGVVAVRRQRHSLAAGFSSGARATRRRRGVSGPDALLVLQVALALILMTGSALMVKTYRNLSHRELGFSAADVTTVEIGLMSRRASQHVRIYHDVVERVRRLPHVESASAASFVPLTATEHLFPVEAGAAPTLFKFFVPGYFQVMKTPIVDGDRFDTGGLPTSPYPVLVSATLARRLFPGQRAIGKTIRRLNPDGTVVEMGRRESVAAVPPFTIAGIVADVREETPRGDPSEIVYIPVVEPTVEQSIVPTNMHLVVRSRAPLGTLVNSIRDTIASVDPGLSVGQIKTMDEIVLAGRAREAFVGVLLVSAAAVSVFLGAIGIYGSVAQVVRRRTREIGIRIALGSGRPEVIRMVTAGSVRAALMGATIGLAAALPAARLLESLLFGVDAHDPIAFLIGMAGLAFVAGLAALLAARQALGVEPVTALRGD